VTRRLARPISALLAATLVACVARVSPVAARDTGKARELRETIDATTLEVAIAPGRLGLGDAGVAHALGTSLRALGAYYGKLPVDRVRVAVTPTQGREINGSTRCGAGGPLVRLSLGPHVDAKALQNDWVVTHELLHVTFTSLDDEVDTFEWVGEGLASYVEPLVRVRAGTLSEATLWTELLEGAPQGLPEAGDRGLNRTHTWGRTYWGGALFWLEVDVLVRERTAGRASIRDVLRAVAAAGATVCVDWPMTRLLATGDAATGTRVLSEVYATRALTNAAPELADWWRKLGVTLEHGHATFDDGAPEAATRRAMTRD
jgi:hypothetical protein